MHQVQAAQKIEMTQTPHKNVNPDTVIQLADLAGNRPTPFDLVADDALYAQLTAALDVLSVNKFTFSGQIETPADGTVILAGKLGASVVQECVVTLEPVKTRIDTSVERTYTNEQAVPDADSIIEIDADDDHDPLPTEFDLVDIAQEVIALNLPTYPRAPGAALETQVFSEPGIAPMTDEDAKPFAGLAALKDKLQN